jgi:hypothetical protein
VERYSGRKRYGSRMIQFGDQERGEKRGYKRMIPVNTVETMEDGEPLKISTNHT